MNPRLPRLLSPDDLPEVELRAAALDGEVYAVGGRWSSVADVDDAWARASSLVDDLGTRTVAARGTAAWVWGTQAAPPRALDAVVRSTARHHLAGPRVRVGEVLIDDDEIVVLGEVSVTSPERTVLDLVRDDEWGPAGAETVRRLVAEQQVDVRRVLALARRRPGAVNSLRGAERLRSIVDPAPASPAGRRALPATPVSRR
ncbi:hypothetical protein EDF38_1435 [Frigoribacterium sp. PhB160]|uniref:hypothetical protein n=1 Tax=Frigoribacterium sp. PhB160 TaxID=2485192 RepID=UPI000F49E795|nr:hypothetical protein [Frigoribacterium sp. PhB160]ROS62325.1 hypothetical protein EDF38_1435 [Frigoribacterium sp. PhB160]